MGWSDSVDGSGTGYLRTVCDYVHLNPVRAKGCSSRSKSSSLRMGGEHYGRERAETAEDKVQRIVGQELK